MMKKTLLAAAALCALTSGAAMAQSQYQQDGKWMVRARAVHLDSSNGGAAGAAGVSVNDKWIPELDISYFFTPNLAAELILTYPQKHDVRLNGAKIGTLKHLPPTLTAQYHFTNLGAFKPYVGAGINYTRFSSVDILNGALTVKKNSWGPALQVGFDYALDKNWSINLDVKKVYIDTEVSGGFGKFKVDPVLVGVGLGYRF
jgi:outer membrane protein